MTGKKQGDPTQLADRRSQRTATDAARREHREPTGAVTRPTAARRGDHGCGYTAHHSGDRRHGENTRARAQALRERLSLLGFNLAPHLGGWTASDRELSVVFGRFGDRDESATLDEVEAWITERQRRDVKAGEARPRPREPLGSQPQNRVSCDSGGVTGRAHSGPRSPANQCNERQGFGYPVRRLGDCGATLRFPPRSSG